MKCLQRKDVTAVRRRPKRFHCAAAACKCVPIYSYWLLAECPWRAYRVFILRSLRVQCANYVHNTLMWRSDIPEDSKRSPCKHSRLIAIMCVTWARKQSSIGVAGDLTALLRRPHFVSNASFYQNAEPRRVRCACSPWRSNAAGLSYGRRPGVTGVLECHVVRTIESLINKIFLKIQIKLKILVTPFWKPKSNIQIRSFWQKMEGMQRKKNRTRRNCWILEVDGREKATDFPITLTWTRVRIESCTFICVSE